MNTKLKSISWVNVYCLEKGCTTQITWRAQKFCFDLSNGQSWYVLTHSKGVFIEETSKINKIWSFVGNIKKLPRATFGPRAVCCAYLWSISSMFFAPILRTKVHSKPNSKQRKDVWTKNARVKSWWNWYLV